MSTKTLFGCAAACTLFAVSLVHGQTPLPTLGKPAFGDYGTPSYESMPQPSMAAPLPGATAPTMQAHYGLSDWITYRRPGQSFDLDNHAPIQTQLYLQAGPTAPFSSDFFGDTLTLGWAIQGGARVLFPTDNRSSAWMLDMSLLNIWNQGKNPQLTTPISILVPDPTPGVSTKIRGNFDVSIRDLNRTFVNVGGGKIWYFGGEDREAPYWSFGVDGGGRYGSASAQFHQVRHRVDVIGGAYVGAHADLEVPCGCCTWTFGVRTEWAYTWSDILQRPSDVQDVLLLFSTGVRY